MKALCLALLHGAVLYALENEARNVSEKFRTKARPMMSPLAALYIAALHFRPVPVNLKTTPRGMVCRQGIYVPRSRDTFGGQRTLGTYRSFIDVKNDGGFSGEDISTVDYTSYQTKLSMPETIKENMRFD